MSILSKSILCAVTILAFCFPCFADDICWDKLVSSVVQVESSGDPTAHNVFSDATGLMQITPIVVYEYNRDNYARIRIEDLFEPEMNKAIGTWYLKKLANYYLRGRDSVEEVLAAYNGGITRLRKNDYDISKMPDETRTYVKRVLKLYKEE